MAITPTMTENKKKADRAADMLLYYQQRQGDPYNVPDLLTDLMHLCDLHGWHNFDEALETARANFQMEKDDAPATIVVDYPLDTGWGAGRVMPIKRSV